MAEIKVGPQKKAGEVAIELIGAVRYVHRSKVYQKGFVYAVSEALAEELLDDQRDNGFPYFRTSAPKKAAEAIAPPAKAIVKKKARVKRKAAPVDDDDEGIEIA